MTPLWIITVVWSSIKPSSILLNVAFVLVFLELPLQGSQADAEDVRRLGAMAGRAVQGFEDRLPLDVGHGARLSRHRLHGRARGGDRRRLPHLDGQVRRRDLLPEAEDHG